MKGRADPGMCAENLGTTSRRFSSAEALGKLQHVAQSRAAYSHTRGRGRRNADQSYHSEFISKSEVEDN